jgi:hypothetical protein
VPRCSNIEAASQFNCTEKRGEFHTRVVGHIPFATSGSQHKRLGTAALNNQEINKEKISSEPYHIIIDSKFKT